MKTINILITYTAFLILLAVVNFVIARHIVALPINEEPQILIYLAIIDIVLVAIASIIVAPMALSNRKYVSVPLTRMNEEMNKLATGNTNIEFTHTNTDEVGQLADSFRSIIEAIRYEDVVLDRLASGDFSENVTLRG
jgi:methyl-accepting chemotaxis protein